MDAPILSIRMKSGDVVPDVCVTGVTFGDLFVHPAKNSLSVSGMPCVVPGDGHTARTTVRDRFARSYHAETPLYTFLRV